MHPKNLRQIAQAIGGTYVEAAGRKQTQEDIDRKANQKAYKRAWGPITKTAKKYSKTHDAYLEQNPEMASFVDLLESRGFESNKDMTTLTFEKDYGSVFLTIRPSAKTLVLIHVDYEDQNNELRIRNRADIPFSKFNDAVLDKVEAYCKAVAKVNIPTWPLFKYQPRNTKG